MILCSIHIGISSYKSKILFQARDKNENVIGKFENTNSNTKTIECDNSDDTITHTNANLKNEIQVNWIAPEDGCKLREEIKFKYTIVEQKQTFVVGEMSQKVEFSELPKKEDCEKTSATSTTAPTSVTTSSITNTITPITMINLLLIIILLVSFF